MSASNIEWTDATWNPTTGCTKVSPGCAHCYAETLTQRYAGAKGWPAEFKPWTPANAAENVVLHPDRLEAPFSWRTPRRVFVNSMSDLFHENVPIDFVAQVYAVMYLAHEHQFQVLTKRPQRAHDLLCNDAFNGLVLDHVRLIQDKRPHLCRPYPEHGGDSLYANVWLGVTVENQRFADERIPILLATPAAVRFVSAEPLLGRVKLFPYLHVTATGEGNAYMHYRERLDWVIVGGESGSGHRPFDPDWARDIVTDCASAAVACFVKQLGGARPGNVLEDLPEDLRVREYPR